MTYISPFEKATMRAEALAALGLARAAGAEEIRAAWKRLVREAHPDREGGSTADFQKISAAYDYLLAEWRSRVGPAPGVQVPRRTRPSLRIRRVDLTEEIVGACRAMLAVSQLEMAEESAPLPAGDIVPFAAEFLGRSVTYLVAGEPAGGTLRVAVPTGELVDRRAALPRMVVFMAGDCRGGCYDVAEEVLAMHFPGATAVRIRFGAEA